jgi:VCBS repeat-containing protein
MRTILPTKTRVMMGVFVLVVLGVVAALAASPAHATEVKGTFHYEDTNPGTGEVTDRPIANAKVEIWRFRSRCFLCLWTWGKDAETRTDANGRLSANMPFAGSGVVYGVRVFATNDSAVVWPYHTVSPFPFYREPGADDTGPINRTERSASDVLDFSYTFHGWSSQHFNIAEVARHGKAFADARRDPSETDPLPPANFQPQDSPTTSYYNPYNDTVVVDNSHVNEDFVILHEYAHYLEDTISKFAPIPAVHDGCSATAAWFDVASPQHAWMEAFASYFSHASRRYAPPGALTGSPGEEGEWSQPQLESPSCPGLPSSTVPGDAVEDFVEGTLWDLSDQPGDPGTDRSETHDTLQRMDREIFQIFDRELDMRTGDPTITHFRDAWVRRGLPSVGLSKIMTKLEIPLRTNFGPTANAGADQAVDEGAAVRLDGSASSDPDLNALNFAWTQVSGPAVTLANPSSATPTFTAPPVSSGSTTLVFRLIVHDRSAPPSAPDDVAVRVNAINEAPVAGNDSYTVAEDATLTVDAPGVLANDSDAENDSLTAVEAGGPSHGSLTLNSDGSFTYTPEAGYVGTDAFTYTANAGTTSSGPATVTITVDPPDDTAAPTGSVLINNGARKTNRLTVRLSLKATDPEPGASGVSEMRFSNDGKTWTAWQPFASSKSWRLTKRAGTKTVYAQYKDRAGNESAAYKDTIRYAP